MTRLWLHALPFAFMACLSSVIDVGSAGDAIRMATFGLLVGPFVKAAVTHRPRWVHVQVGVHR